MKQIKAQNFKAQILSEIAPHGFNSHAFADDLRMIKKPSRSNSASRILMSDGGWIELDVSGRTVRTWGPVGRAQVLAAALADAIGIEVTHLAQTASVGADAAAAHRVMKHSEETVEALVKWWAMRGYIATAAPDGCWIIAGHARIRDMGDQLEIYGGLSDEAIAATITKARDAWGGGVYLDGVWSQSEQDRMWIAAMREGIEVQNCLPSQEIQKRWRSEQGAAENTNRTMSAVRSEISVAQDLLEAAKGSIEAAKRLPSPLQAFVGSYLDDDQRKQLAVQPVAEVIPNLKRFRSIGALELEAYEAPVGRKIHFAVPDKEEPWKISEKAHVPQ